ncbi:oxidoreductase, short-chaindehydrogenase/reductase family [Weissella oryzae SG25]|uniref:Oxidoreductase, short-chaindehydrogenase/reductase family n=1 Tax=Weissella oryzae (strain DSM 25784 / JCM 18191 / LMG 30913 / SG25) TaxID=1329250 RepID=A0A069CUD4_WEIOS|nr:SDR family oxidoreductase [Weissella oryzae]GAK30808.1 oxidoreductase, short-chaindehydrogenase/reductase family [Weissella oryzae SG25]
MSKENLVNPKDMFYSEKFPKQDQDTPALQRNMEPKPDCGEDSYTGHDELLGRKVLITGGDSGIGRAVAIAFAREGADVAIQFLPGEEADAIEVKEYIEETGREALLLPFDLRDETAPKKIIDQVITQFGGVDGLVLNAAQQISVDNLQELTLEQIRDTFAVNIFSMMELVKAANPYFEPGATIINTTSVQAYNPSPHLLDYAATKAAISNYTINLSQIMAKKGVRVNGVAPGPIWTPLQLDHGQPNDAITDFGQDSLIGRAGQPAELAHIYVFLTSNKASYVTGQIYGVTGGQAIN